MGLPDKVLKRLIVEVVADPSGLANGGAALVVAGSPVFAGAPSWLFVDDVLSGLAGSAASGFTDLFCFKALKQARRSARCSVARQQYSARKSRA